MSGKKSDKQYTWVDNKKVELTPAICASQIQWCYAHWKYEYENGVQDPMYPDGVNLNLVRMHIRYWRNKIEELLGDNYFLYPDEYFWCDIPELPSNYMAKPRQMLLFYDHYRKACIGASPREYEVCF